eukprot:1906499-Pyramimonas_sp.AAC.1
MQWALADAVAGVIGARDKPTAAAARWRTHFWRRSCGAEGRRPTETGDEFGGLLPPGLRRAHAGNGRAVSLRAAATSRRRRRRSPPVVRRTTGASHRRLQVAWAPSAD